MTSPFAALQFFYLLLSFWPILVIFLIWRWATHRRHSGEKQEILKPRLAVMDGLFNTHLKGGTAFIIIILLLALVGISERVLYDLARNFVGPTYSYYDDLRTITVHALVIIPLLVVSIILNVVVGKKRGTYALVLTPYFATSIILTIQLIAQISVYFYNHHTKPEFYVVIVLISGITSYAIYFIQNLYNEKLEEMHSLQKL